MIHRRGPQGEIEPPTQGSNKIVRSVQRLAATKIVRPRHFLRADDLVPNDRTAAEKASANGTPWSRLCAIVQTMNGQYFEGALPSAVTKDANRSATPH